MDTEINDGEIHQSVQAVSRAIEALNRVFEKRLVYLRETDHSDQLKQWSNACYTMQDSGNLYVNWARHYAKTVQHHHGQDGADLLTEDDFLEE